MRKLLIPNRLRPSKRDLRKMSSKAKPIPNINLSLSNNNPNNHSSNILSPKQNQHQIPRKNHSHPLRTPPIQKLIIFRNGQNIHPTLTTLKNHSKHRPKNKNRYKRRYLNHRYSLHKHTSIILLPLTS